MMKSVTCTVNMSLYNLLLEYLYNFFSVEGLTLKTSAVQTRYGGYFSFISG